MYKSHKEVRAEQEIFCELKQLSGCDGFLYVMAYLATRDDIIPYAGDIQGEDLSTLYSEERLIRTETSTLLGLAVQGQLSLNIPCDEDFWEMVERTSKLMQELHASMVVPIKIENNDSDLDSGNSGSLYKEAFFYIGETAYYFQYRDIAPLKYQKDSDWLKINHGYDVEQGHRIVKTICNLYEQSIQGITDLFSDNTFSPDKLLESYTFTIDAICEKSGLNKDIIRSFLSDFSIGKRSNESFEVLSDFNLFNARPLIEVGDDEFCIFNLYSLSEAFYESPFYWMCDDDDYFDAALSSRGEFTERYSEGRLKSVFGESNVFTNVLICEGKYHICEVDVLVIFANRAIILQAKSKKLTLESRKGNDKKIKSDFQAGIQDSYNQGYECASRLEIGGYKIIDSTGSEIQVPSEFGYIYILSVVLDTYPALGFQARQFLEYKTTKVIQPPFVLDICQLDVICEMLSSPLRFLSYLHTRVNYFDNIVASDELVVLAYHLKTNLHIPSEIDVINLHNDVSSHLDAAMLVRRLGYQGPDTPPGILTKYLNEPLSQLIAQIEHQENIAIIDLGQLILSANGEVLDLINDQLKTLTKSSKESGGNHDFGFEISGMGVTIHCNSFQINEAQNRIIAHCQLRKHAEKVECWHGLVIAPALPIQIRFGVKLSQKWEPSAEMDELIPDSWNENAKNRTHQIPKKKSKKSRKKSKSKMQKQSRRKNRRKK